jgi:hypothetical protein
MHTTVPLRVSIAKSNISAGTHARDLKLAALGGAQARAAPLRFSAPANPLPRRGRPKRGFFSKMLRISPLFWPVTRWTIAPQAQGAAPPLWACWTALAKGYMLHVLGVRFVSACGSGALSRGENSGSVITRRPVSQPPAHPAPRASVRARARMMATAQCALYEPKRAHQL